MSVTIMRLLCFLLAINVGFLAWNVTQWTTRVSSDATTAQSNISHFDYVGYSFPLEFGMKHSDVVAMTLHETVRFSLNASDIEGDAEWYTTVLTPRGSGRIRLGPDHRVLVPSFWHQMHCLRKIQVSIANEHLWTHSPNSTVTPEHIQHCLNYIRQTLLCEAAESLEEGDFVHRDIERDRLGGSLACWDWEAVYNEMGENFDSWLASRGA